MDDEHKTGIFEYISMFVSHEKTIKGWTHPNLGWVPSDQAKALDEEILQ